MVTHQPERRRAQRVETRLKLEVQISLRSGLAETATWETLNLSSSGVYFRSDRFIEPMTKLEMVFELPTDETATSRGSALIRCEGLVVRVTPDAPAPDADAYEIAVFFTHFAPEALARLEQHVALMLAAS